MAVSLVNTTGALHFSAVTTTTPTLQGGRVNGNLLVAFCFNNVANAISVVGSGWNFGPGTTATGIAGRLAWRLIDGTEPNPQFTWGGATASGTARIFQFSGIDAVSPVGNTNFNAAASGTTLSCTGVTTTKANSLIYVGGGVIGFQTLGVPNNYTQLDTPNNTNQSDGHWYETVAGSGVSADNVSLTISNGAWVALMMEVKSATVTAIPDVLGLASAEW
jgi:hypothetical protein